MRLQIVVLALTLLAAARAIAAPADDLERARNAFRSGTFEDAIPLLAKLLYPRPSLADQAELAEAHLLLGVSYFETGDSRSAQREIDEALFIDSNLTLDKSLFSDSVVRFFDDRKRALEDQKHALDEARRAAEQRDLALKLLKGQVVVERRSRLVNLIPFGAGQYQNGQRNKAVFFLVTGLPLASGSLGLFIYLSLRGSVPVEDVDTVRKLQITQSALGGAAMVFMVWGVIDGFVHFKPEKRTQPQDPDLLPEELRKLLEEDPGPKPPRSSFRLAPVPHPGGAGLSASWEF